MVGVLDALGVLDGVAVFVGDGDTAVFVGVAGATVLVAGGSVGGSGGRVGTIDRACAA